MNFTQFVKYARPFNILFLNNIFNDTSAVSIALLKSGLGIKNIDCYLHSGVMEDIYVNYPNNNDSLENQKAIMLYTSINTSYPLNYSEKGFYGHYYIKHDNYIIRFYNNAMQVSKPKDVLSNKNSKDIILNYENQYNIKNLNSNEITKLILN